MSWKNQVEIESRQFTCGLCGSLTGYNRGFKHESNGSWLIYICPVCDKPNIFLKTYQYPSQPFGNPLYKLPDDLRNLYDDARNCISINAFTASVMLCRKILMNFAVSEGAKENGSFLNYVDYLADNSFISPKAKDWVNHIRTKGNEANHEICLMERQDAEDIILFTEILLKSNIEFPEKRQLIEKN